MPSPRLDPRELRRRRRTPTWIWTLVPASAAVGVFVLAALLPRLFTSSASGPDDAAPSRRAPGASRAGGAGAGAAAGGERLDRAASSSRRAEPGAQAGTKASPAPRGVSVVPRSPAPPASPSVRVVERPASVAAAPGRAAGAGAGSGVAAVPAPSPSSAPEAVTPPAPEAGPAEPSPAVAAAATPPPDVPRPAPPEEQAVAPATPPPPPPSRPVVAAAPPPVAAAEDVPPAPAPPAGGGGELLTLRGDWLGTYDGKRATLNITRENGETGAFDATLTVEGTGGPVRIAVRGALDESGNVAQVTLTESRVVSEPVKGSWRTGLGVGRLTDQGDLIVGVSHDADGRRFNWRLHRR